MPKEIVHYDKFGTQLKIGDAVVFPHTNKLFVGTVIKFNTVMVKVKSIDKIASKYSWREVSNELNKYPSDLSIIDSSTVTMYVLKKQL